MYSHKLPDGYNFWLDLKNLFLKNSYSQSQVHPIINSNPVPFATGRTKATASSMLQQKKEISAVSLKQNAGKWRKDWGHFILADLDYSRSTPDGGFSNIEVLLDNKTAACIDYVQFSVSTFEESGKLYKSEYAEVFNVAPLSSVNIPVYSSPKGKSLNVSITQIISSAIDLQYSQNAYE